MTRLYTPDELPQNNMTKRKMPSPAAIFRYWIDNKQFVDLDIFIFSKLQCMACGFNHRNGNSLDCAHIVARHHGGSDDVSNIHLLCRNCHIESESLSEEYYWKWFKIKNRDAKLYTGFEIRDLLGRDPDFPRLISEEKFFEAASWVQAIYAFPSLESTEELAKKLEQSARKNY